MISRKEFEALLKAETDARDHYNLMLSQVISPDIRKDLEEIRDEEAQHMKMAEQLLKLIDEQ